MYKDFNIDEITKAIGEFEFGRGQRRQVKLYTGEGGYDLFEESMEYKLTGKKRFYIGKKVSRILRIKKLQPKKSRRKGWYYLVNLN